MRKAKAKVKKENSERWLLTYSDLITLLMAFFVIMYAMSNVSESKFRALAQQLAIAFNADGGAGVLNSGTGIMQTPYQAETQALEEAASTIEAAAASQNVAPEVQVGLTDEGLSIRLKDALMFAPGSAQLTTTAELFLDSVASELATLKNPVRIEGHTDNVPVRNSQFRSNWELSAVRAANVLEYLVTRHAIDPSRLSIAGYGEYRPIASNGTADGRAVNRRVEILIERIQQPDSKDSSSTQTP